MGTETVTVDGADLIVEVDGDEANVHFADTEKNEMREYLNMREEVTDYAFEGHGVSIGVDSSELKPGFGEASPLDIKYMEPCSVFDSDIFVYAEYDE